MKRLIKKSGLLSAVLVLFLFAFFTNIGLAYKTDSDSTKMKKSEIKQKKEKMDMPMHDHSKMQEGKKGKETVKKGAKAESIVRTGVINVGEIDKNKDGKVYQDPMDWNVISDNPGKCPLCKMTLEEVTISKAKENLQKNGFKIKKY